MPPRYITHFLIVNWVSLRESDNNFQRSRHRQRSSMPLRLRSCPTLYNPLETSDRPCMYNIVNLKLRRSVIDFVSAKEEVRSHDSPFRTGEQVFWVMEG